MSGGRRDFDWKLNFVSNLFTGTYCSDLGGSVLRAWYEGASRTPIRDSLPSRHAGSRTRLSSESWNPEGEAWGETNNPSRNRPAPPHFHPLYPTRAFRVPAFARGEYVPRRRSASGMTSGVSGGPKSRRGMGGVAHPQTLPPTFTLNSEQFPQAGSRRVVFDG